MIRLHRLNDFEITLNAELIESVECCGQQTTIHLTTGNRFVVKESVDEVIQRAVQYRQHVNAVQAERRLSCP